MKRALSMLATGIVLLWALAACTAYHGPGHPATMGPGQGHMQRDLNGYYGYGGAGPHHGAYGRDSVNVPAHRGRGGGSHYVQGWNWGVCH